MKPIADDDVGKALLRCESIVVQFSGLLDRQKLREAKIENGFDIGRAKIRRHLLFRRKFRFRAPRGVLELPLCRRLQRVAALSRPVRVHVDQIHAKAFSILHCFLRAVALCPDLGTTLQDQAKQRSFLNLPVGVRGKSEKTLKTSGSL